MYAFIFSARCNIYISCLCHDASPSVRLSVTEVHWRIIANLGFKFRSHFTAHCGKQHGRRAVLLAGGSSHAMLASARLSCSTSASGIVVTLRRIESWRQFRGSENLSLSCNSQSIHASRHDTTRRSSCRVGRRAVSTGYNKAFVWIVSLSSQCFGPIENGCVTVNFLLGPAQEQRKASESLLFRRYEFPQGQTMCLNASIHF